MLRQKTHSSAQVSLVRLDSYEPNQVEAAIRSLLEPLGGVERFVHSGSCVVLKPNLLLPYPPERAVCTHPEIIRAVARIARSVGAKTVEATDSPGVGPASICARRLGLTAREPFDLKDADDGFDAAVPGSSFHHLNLSRRMVDAEVLINLPKAKTHSQMVMTGAVKNTFGAVIGLEKKQWHFRIGKDPMSFAKLLVHIHARVKPHLNILDAVLAMEGNGPGSGTPRAMNLLMASTCAHCLDAVLCRIWDIHPNAVFTLAVAKQQGLLPRTDQIEVIGDIEQFIPVPPWRMARPVPMRYIGRVPWLVPVLDRFLSLKPVVDHSKCIGCGDCRDSCAAGAIALVKKRNRSSTKSKFKVIIDNDKCISCFCCQEICGQGAISVAAGPLARLLRLGTK